MPAATLVIVFGSWALLLGLALWVRARASRDDEDGP
jgi:hypothetical protein